MPNSEDDHLTFVSERPPPEPPPRHSRTRLKRPRAFRRVSVLILNVMVMTLLLPLVEPKIPLVLRIVIIWVGILFVGYTARMLDRTDPRAVARIALTHAAIVLGLVGAFMLEHPFPIGAARLVGGLSLAWSLTLFYLGYRALTANRARIR